jgi:hypothetical protein
MLRLNCEIVPKKKKKTAFDRLHNNMFLMNVLLYKHICHEIEELMIVLWEPTWSCCWPTVARAAARTAVALAVLLDASFPPVLDVAIELVLEVWEIGW